MTNAIAFRRLLIDGRFEADQVDAFLRRLAQVGAPRPLVFETQAGPAGLSWFVGTPDPLLPSVRALVRDYLGGARLGRIAVGDRVEADVARIVRVTKVPVPLDHEHAEEVSAALYSAFAWTRGDERLRLQVVLGKGHSPYLVPQNTHNPTASLFDALTTGTRGRATGKVRTRMEERAALPSIEVTIRIGVNSGHPERRRELGLGVFGAIRLLDTAGTELRLGHDSVAHLRDGSQALIRRSRMTSVELVPLLGLPLGDADLPGLPAHPRRPLPPEKIEAKENVFATISAPGDNRQVGVSTLSLTHHAVVSGPTGSGKSTVLLAWARSLVLQGAPIAFLDPKRQASDILLDTLPKSVAGRVAVLDLSDTTRPLGFNPLDTTGRNTDVVVDGILASFKAVFEDGWGPRTEHLLFGALKSLALAGERRREPYTLIDLVPILTDAAFRRSVVGRVQDDPVLATFWAAFDDLSEGARANMIAAPLNKLSKLMLRSNLVAMLGQARPAFRVRDLFKSDRALLIPLNDALVGSGSAELAGSLIVAELFLAAQERAAEADPRSHPGVVMIDEAQRFIHLPTALDDALSTSRGYGVAWIAAHQYRSQMTETLRAGFDANATNKVVFRSRPKDARDYAAMSPTLEAEDFMSLDRYEFYTTLMHQDVPSPWFAARALPPAKPLGYGDLIRHASREAFGGEPGRISPPAAPDEPPSGGRGRKARRT